ncbi:hypothetical protein HDU98_005039 [Podochytrium sp. JEL0797]|nr:hypothetical protein HDU98_005039 [Podochytrium sp. JEL0797]
MVAPPPAASPSHICIYELQLRLVDWVSGGTVDESGFTIATALAVLDAIEAGEEGLVGLVQSARGDEGVLKRGVVEWVKRGGGGGDGVVASIKLWEDRH